MDKKPLSASNMIDAAAKERQIALTKTKLPKDYQLGLACFQSAVDFLLTIGLKYPTILATLHDTSVAVLKQAERESNKPKV